MTVVHIRPGSPGQISTLTGHLVVAVDLGFSKTSRSCGVAWQKGSGVSGSRAFRFGECVEKVADLLSGYPTAVLIIEAPLSGAFTISGNPVERGEFERTKPESPRTTHRYWYVGGGGVMCLAAVFFLRELLAKLQRFSNRVEALEMILYEGFVTFKTELTKDVSDAQLLLRCFFGKQACTVVDVTPSGSQSVVAVTSIVTGQGSGSIAPSIIVPSESDV